MKPPGNQLRAKVRFEKPPPTSIRRRPAFRMF